jgi:hypothetical protein
MAIKSRILTNYVKAKKLAEEKVEEICPEAKILRPSSIYNLQRLERASVFEKLPFPRVGTKFRPIFIGKFVESILSALNAGRGVYEVGDKEIVSFLEFVRACIYPKKLRVFSEKFFWPFFLLPRVRFMLEDKIFENDIEKLGVKPVDTFEAVFQERFGDDCEKKLVDFRELG